MEFQDEKAWRELDDERVAYINRIGDILGQVGEDSLEDTAIRVMQRLDASLAREEAYREEAVKLGAELATLKQSASGHMRLFRLFSCEGGDCYDPECAEKNLDKVMEILSK